MPHIAIKREFGSEERGAELDGKRQEILIEAIPGIRHIAALADTNRTHGARLEALREAAHGRNVELSIHQIVRPEEIPAAVILVFGFQILESLRFLLVRHLALIGTKPPEGYLGWFLIF